ncbi:MAG: hypothetical protein WCK34_05075 [Bacteroidota bacterium]
MKKYLLTYCYASAICPAGDSGFMMATWAVITWERFFGGENSSFADLDITADSGFIAAGRSSGPGQSSSAYLVKTDDDGFFTGTPSALEKSMVAVFPNPVEGKCRAVLPPGTLRTGIYSADGQMIHSREFTGSAGRMLYPGSSNAGFLVPL